MQSKIFLIKLWFSYRLPLESNNKKCEVGGVWIGLIIEKNLQFVCECYDSRSSIKYSSLDPHQCLIKTVDTYDQKKEGERNKKNGTKKTEWKAK